MPAIHQDINMDLPEECVGRDSEGSNIQGLFEEAAPFIQQLNRAAEIESLTDIEDSSVALERLSELSDVIAHQSSDSVKEISLKVALYRAIAPEIPQHQDSLTSEERLLGSIMSDIENFVTLE